jgi:hypothetical protein
MWAHVSQVSNRKILSGYHCSCPKTIPCKTGLLRKRTVLLYNMCCHLLRTFLGIVKSGFENGIVGRGRCENWKFRSKREGGRDTVRGWSRSYYSVSLNYKTFVEIKKKRTFFSLHQAYIFTRTHYYYYYIYEHVSHRTSSLFSFIFSFQKV